ncbi:hypothetical protein BJ546DRAFT_719170 [Cryomyces antarcticus]
MASISSASIPASLLATMPATAPGGKQDGALPAVGTGPHSAPPPSTTTSFSRLFSLASMQGSQLTNAATPLSAVPLYGTFSSFQPSFTLMATADASSNTISATLPSPTVSVKEFSLLTASSSQLANIPTRSTFFVTVFTTVLVHGSSQSALLASTTSISRDHTVAAFASTKTVYTTIPPPTTVPAPAPALNHGTSSSADSSGNSGRNAYATSVSVTISLIGPIASYPLEGPSCSSPLSSSSLPTVIPLTSSRNSTQNAPQGYIGPKTSQSGSSSASTRTTSTSNAPGITIVPVNPNAATVTVTTTEREKETVTVTVTSR